MNRSTLRPRLLGSSILLAAAIGFGATVPVFADTVTQTLNAGVLSASFANGTMSPITVSHTDQTSTGTLTLSADDSTGSALGWNVSVLTSDFAYTGAYGTQLSIDAANLSIASAANPILVAGQAVSLTAANGPQVPPTSPVGGTLNTARRVIQATAAYGSGAYTQAVGVALIVPGDSRPGTYTGTLTTTILSGSV
jgi:hypothetical protein